MWGVQDLDVVSALLRRGKNGSQGSILSSDIVEISSRSPDAPQFFL
jgi:hypothetical protein